MKSPEALQEKLFKQWQLASYRVSRLLDAEQWPLSLSIGKPTSRQVEQESEAVNAHIRAWKQVTVGRVIWQTQSFKRLAEPLSVPVIWELAKPSQWVAAVNLSEMTGEFSLLDQVLHNAPKVFREPLIRKRHLWRGKTAFEVSRCISLATQLGPGSAEGKPLRLMAGLEVDTKFFERNANLLVALLDERFEGEASKQGLSVFLNAKLEDDHWLLVLPLQVGLLPFPRCRLSTKELEQCELPAKTILVIENERCEYLLPSFENTIAILGAGLDLGWLGSDVFKSKRVIYWGDIDTWGFQMLAKARQIKPDLIPLLMDKNTFERCQNNSAVNEPVKAKDVNLEFLSVEEQTLYQSIQNMEKGRLEQEFIPADMVEESLRIIMER